MKISHKRNRERGIALLFALGILALLMVLGLAFVTNALLARKVAFNNSSRTQAKMLAQSAVSRAALSIMFYQYQLVRTDPASWPKEFTSICSYDEVKTNGGSNVVVRDQLDYGNSRRNRLYSKLNYLDSDLDYKGYEDSNASWAFLYAPDAASGSGKKIIGRIAYQVLPSATESRLNMQQVLNGCNTAGYAHRLGKDVNELFIDAAAALSYTDGGTKYWSDCAPTAESDVPDTYDDLLNAYGSTLFSDAANPEDSPKFAWVKRWLKEGRKRSGYEVFEIGDEGKKYNRFNLSSTVTNTGVGDPWYARFTHDNSVNTNNDAAVGNLAAPAKRFRETSKYSPPASGLPFLKQIGETGDKGGFETIEAFRKQIAANFNDYCDADDIPTSNIAATAWPELTKLVAAGSGYNLHDKAEWPKYTGNEKDYSINEIALALEATPSVPSNALTSFTGDSIKTVLTLQPHLVAEVVDVYGLSASDGERAMTLDTAIQKLDIECEVTVSGKFFFRYSIGEGMFQETHMVADDIKVTASASAAPQDLTMDLTGSPTDGYRTGSVQGTAFTLENDLTDAFKTAWDNLDLSAYANPEFQKAEISSQAVFKITNVTFRLAPVALSRMIDAVQTGIDFVRCASDTDIALTPDLELFSEIDSSEEHIPVPEPTVAHKFFILGGMQAYDPRQNLNPKYSAVPGDTDAQTSDWFWSPRLANYSDTIDNDVLTMTMTFTDGEGSHIASVTGRKNNYSSPAAPGKMPADSYDLEIAADPAWRGTDANQHISTAFIRNAPMKSPWEIGAIHRAQAWRTLNLTSAERPGGSGDDDTRPEDFTNSGSWSDSPGTSYAGGDGAILEQIKMTPRTRSYGKVDVNMLITAGNSDYSTSPSDGDMFKALIANLSLGNQLHNIDVTPAEDYSGWVDDTAVTSTIIDRVKAAHSKGDASHNANEDGKFLNRVQFLHYADGADNGLWNGFGLASPPAGLGTDAAQEEIVGKTVNLLGASANELPTTVQVLIIAQSIRDLGNDTGIAITKLKHDGTAETVTCKQGQFDYITDATAASDSPDQWLYFDEITGEVKMLVTLDRDPDPDSGRLVVRKIEYLE